MSKLFDDPRPNHTHHGEPEQEPMVSSILWMLTIRLTGILIVGIILGIIIYRRVPRGRNALWRLLKSTKAEAHMHAVVAGQDKDGYDVWRTSTSSSVQDSYGIKPDEMCIKDGELKGLLYAPNKDVLTLKDLLLHVADKYKGARALGQRKLIKEHKEKKTIHGEEREWTSYEKGPYEWLTYHEVLTHVKQLSCGLLALGLRPRESVCLFLDTCMEWQLMAHACFHSNLPVATAYASLGKKGLSHALAQTEGRALLTHASLFSTVLKSLKKCDTLQYVFYVGEPDKHELEALEQALIKRAQKAADVESRVITFDKLLKIGKYNVSTVAEDPKPDDVALVMYTSGATGTPKGVLLSHANFVASVAGYAADLESCFDPTTDKYLAYLPLAHVLEFTVEQAALYLGIPIGYGNPRTLTDASMKNSKGDAKELQPTIMAGVPEVFERIRKTVEGQVIKQGGIAKHLFSAAFAFRRKLIDFNTDVPFVDQLLFRRVKAELGGKLKLVASGAAPLSKNNQMFLRACLGVQVIQGYALTETAGAGTLQANDDPTFSNVGRPNMCCEIKLVDVPKMGYTTDDEEGPAGEILIRGPNVSRGYLYLEDKTKEDFKDGWFSTGDIGRWIEGRLYIIDRKKNLVKLSSGEYIALEKLETLYKESSMVQNVMIHANTEENLLVAVVQPKKGNDDEDALLSEFESIAKKNQLSRVERVARVIVDTEEWTPENGLVTATAKLNRQELESKFKDQLEQAADEGSEGGGGDDNHERRDKADRNTTRAGKQER